MTQLIDRLRIPLSPPSCAGQTRAGSSGRLGLAGSTAQRQSPAIGPGSQQRFGTHDGHHLDRASAWAAAKVPVPLRRLGEPEPVKDRYRVEGTVQGCGVSHHLRKPWTLPRSRRVMARVSTWREPPDSLYGVSE